MNKVGLILFIVFFILTIYSSSICAQPNDFKGLVEKDIKRLNRNIEKLLLISECFPNDQDYRIVHIFNVSYDGDLNKSDFSDKFFLGKIKPTYFSQKNLLFRRKLINTVALIINDDKVLIAISDGRRIYCVANYKKSAFNTYQEYIQKIGMYDSVLAFNIELTPLGTIFLVTPKNDISVIELREKIIEYSLIDYLKCCWDTLQK